MDRIQFTQNLGKTWHTYKADTRLSFSSPPCALLESLGMRLLEPYYSWIIVILTYILA